MSFKEFTSALGNGDVEADISKRMLVSFASSIILFGILYYFGFRSASDFIPKYGFFIFFSILSYAILLPSIGHIRAYKEFPCMSGMMIGMTIGMIAGFLPGFFIGATNGMFYGSVFGMAIGIFFGAWNGKCCGIMGVMEGIMAGFMGGLMGAMSSVMMLNDHLRAASVVVFVVSAVILIGLNYMIYNEAKSMSNKGTKKEGAFFTVFWSMLLTLLTIIMMAYGPRSFLFQ